jgi:hypothetical protein
MLANKALAEGRQLAKNEGAGRVEGWPLAKNEGAG